MSKADQTQDESPGRSKSPFSLAAIGTLAATISLILLLLGYGVSLAVETRFGIPHATLYDSPSDIIDLASLAFVVLMTGGIKVIFGLEFLAKAYKDGWPILLLMVILAVVGFGVAMWWLRGGAGRSAAPRIDKKSWLVRLGPQLALILGIASTPVVAGLVGMAIVMCGMFICILPIFGMQAAEVHLKEWVIDPKECRPLPEELNGRKGPFVDCVVVKKPGDDPEKPDVILGEGRVVLATTKYVVLWAPGEHARRVPVAEAVIEPVSTIRQAVVQTKPKDAAEGTGTASSPTQASEAASAPAASQPSK